VGLINQTPSMMMWCKYFFSSSFLSFLNSLIL